MHAEADALLNAIWDNPDDDTPRLVYADWLQEHDQEPLARFTRLQCAVAPLMNDNPQRLPLREQEKKVWASVRKQWPGFFQFTGAKKDWFHRGFLNRHLRLDAVAFFNRYPEWADWCPVTALTLTNATCVAEQIAAHPVLLARVTHLRLEGTSENDIPAGVIEALTHHTRLDRLKSLEIIGARTGRDTLRRLAAAAWVDHLRFLCLAVRFEPAEPGGRRSVLFEKRLPGSAPLSEQLKRFAETGPA